MLLTSRRDEHHWLGGLPARVQLPADADAGKPAAGRGARRPARWQHRRADWRPLLRYAAGNPLTITVLIGQALRGGLATAEAIEGFVAQLRAGEAQLEAGEDAALGRTQSLAASLSYGFAQAFTEAERPSWRCCTCSATPPAPTSSAYMGDPGRSGRMRCPSWPG